MLTFFISLVCRENAFFESIKNFSLNKSSLTQKMHRLRARFDHLLNHNFPSRYIHKVKIVKKLNVSKTLRFTIDPKNWDFSIFCLFVDYRFTILRVDDQAPTFFKTSVLAWHYCCSYYVTRQVKYSNVCALASPSVLFS